MTPEQLAAHHVTHNASQQRYIDGFTPQRLETLNAAKFQELISLQPIQLYHSC